MVAIINIWTKSYGRANKNTSYCLKIKGVFGRSSDFTVALQSAVIYQNRTDKPKTYQPSPENMKEN